MAIESGIIVPESELAFAPKADVFDEQSVGVTEEYGTVENGTATLHGDPRALRRKYIELHGKVKELPHKHIRKEDQQHWADEIDPRLGKRVLIDPRQAMGESEAHEEIQAYVGRTFKAQLGSAGPNGQQDISVVKRALVTTTTNLSRDGKVTHESSLRTSVKLGSGITTIIDSRPTPINGASPSKAPSKTRS